MRTFENYQVCVAVLLTLFLPNTQGVCDVPNFVTINEDQTGNIFNNSIPIETAFTWNIIDVSGHPWNTLQIETQEKIKEYFEYDRNNMSVWINVKKPIDKESLLSFIKIIVSQIKLRVTCDKTLTDMTLVVASVNEFPPEFEKNYYPINVSESTAIRAVVYTINDVTDRDVDEPDQSLTYSMTTDLPEFDGTPYFAMESGTSPNILLRQTVDYDGIIKSGKIPNFLIRVKVSDHGGKSDDALFNFTILNEDDLPPAFIIPDCDSSCTPSYKAIVSSGYMGELTNVTPAVLHAEDQDKQHSVTYSLDQDSAGYFHAFNIDPNTGVLTAKTRIFSTVALIIRATEVSSQQRFALANMLVKIATNASGEPPRVGQSLVEDTDNSMTTIVIVVSIIAVLIIVALTIALVIYCKRQREKGVKPGDIASSQSTSRDALNGDKELSSSRQELLQSYAMFMTNPDGKNSKLPPITTADMMIGTDEFKKRSRKRKKRELEVFDGTKEYDMEADIGFFRQGTKSKIKRSTRSIKEQRLDPKYWITVQNGYLE